MYKLIIIDDEAVIRNGLKKFVDWEGLGIKVVELFEDGKEAIEFLKSNDVDIVLTDIKMNEMSGLDVAKFVYETKPITKTVILSGYKEFDYARKAIEFKVQHYLLKPTNFPNIHKVFKAIVSELDVESETSSIVPMLRAQYINDICMGGIQSRQIIEKRGSLLGFDETMSQPCALLVYTINEFDSFLENVWGYGRERLNIALSNLLGSREYDVIFHSVYNDGNEFYVFAYQRQNTLMKFEDLVNQELMKAIINTRTLLGIDLIIKCLDFSNNFIEFANKQEIISSPLDSDDINPKIEVDVETYRTIIRKYKLFYSKLNEGDEEAVGELTETLFTQLKSLHLDFAKKIIIDLFASLSDKFSRIDMDIVTMTQGSLNYSTIMRMKELREIEDKCRFWLGEMLKVIKNQSTDSSERVVTKAIDYITSNYNKDISLEDIANHVYLNPVYFCRFFKQKTGENFTDFLTKVRMDKAVELIALGQYKTYEISELVGYKNSKYFSRVFRQHTGMSPSEYGKRQGN